jgi:hypothetical protein
VCVAFRIDFLDRPVVIKCTWDVSLFEGKKTHIGVTAISGQILFFNLNSNPV